jgi:hypothetical protein
MYTTSASLSSLVRIERISQQLFVVKSLASSPSNSRQARALGTPRRPRKKDRRVEEEACGQIANASAMAE